MEDRTAEKNEKGVVDPLGIFEEIKKELSFLGIKEMSVFGSRARGKSYTLKWDFDVLINVKRERLRELQTHFNNWSLGKKDERGRDVKVDIGRSNIDLKDLSELKNNILY